MEPVVANSDLWSPLEIQQQFERCSDKILNVSAKRFTEDSFAIFLRLLKINDIKKIIVKTNSFNQRQTELILALISSNEKKGIKLVDEKGAPFGACYTNWEPYNMAKKDDYKLGLCETTQEALKHLGIPPYHVIDFGAGTGRNSIPLLEKKQFHIYAIDGDEGALEILKSNAQEILQNQTKTDLSERSTLKCFKGPFILFKEEQKVDLFISRFTWPYRPKDDFPPCWQKTIDVLKLGGIIAGHFFSPPDVLDPGMTYHTEEELKALLKKNFEILWFYKELNGQRQIYGGDKAPWGELFHVVAKKNN